MKSIFKKVVYFVTRKEAKSECVSPLEQSLLEFKEAVANTVADKQKLGKQLDDFNDEIIYKTLPGYKKV